MWRCGEMQRLCHAAEAERSGGLAYLGEGELQASTSWRRPLPRWPTRPAHASLGAGDHRRGGRGNNSTLVLPFAVELLRFLENTPPDVAIGRKTARAIRADPKAPLAGDQGEARQRARGRGT